MTDAKRWIEDIKRAEPPELWSTIEQRMERGPVIRPSVPTHRPLLAVAILTVSALVLGSALYGLGQLGDRSTSGPAAGEIVRYAFDLPPQPMVVGEGAAWVKVAALDGRPQHLARIDAMTGDVTRIDAPGGDWPAVGGGSAWLLCNAGAQGCDEGSLTQLDPDTGEVIRSVALPAPGAQIAGTADGVWVTTDAGVSFIDSTGEVIRSFQTQNRDLLGTDGSELWVSDGGAVTKFDPETGDQLERVPFGDVCTMEVAEGIVWVASCGGGLPQGGADGDRLMGIDAASGEVLFQRTIEGYGQMRYADGALYLAQSDPTNNDRLRILRFDPRTGADLGDPITIPRSPQVNFARSIGSPHVFFAIGEGSLWLTDLGAGEVIRLGIPSAFIGTGSPSLIDLAPLTLETSVHDAPADWTEVAFISGGGAEGEIGIDPCFHCEALEPAALAIQADGSLWIADSYKRRIAHYSEEGAFLGAIPMQRGPADVTFAGDRLYALVEQGKPTLLPVDGGELADPITVNDGGKPLSVQALIGGQDDLVALIAGAERLLGGYWAYATVDQTTGQVTSAQGVQVPGGPLMDLVPLLDTRPLSYEIRSSGASAGDLQREVRFQLMRDDEEVRTTVGDTYIRSATSGGIATVVSLGDGQGITVGKWYLEVSAEAEAVAFERLPDDALVGQITVGPDGSVYLLRALEDGVHIYRR